MKKLLYGILTKNEYDVLKLRLNKSRTFSEIAKDLDISNRSNAYIIFNNAIKKLRSAKILVKEFNL